MSKRAVERPIPIRKAVVEHDMLLAALPHPILVVSDGNQIIYGNAAAESFLSTSAVMLTRLKLDDIIAFGCPLLTLVEQVRESGATVNEYGVEMASPKFANAKLVDVYAGPMNDSSQLIVIMLQQRTMAQMIERQLTHRAAARSVSGMAAVLAHEIKNPLSGIKGAAQLLEQGLSDEDRALSQLICSETDRIRNLVNRMEVFGDERPLAKEPVNIHDVLNHVRRLSETGFGRSVRIIEDYDPSLPPIPGNRDKLVQAFLNLLKNAVEAIGDNDEGQGRIIMQTSFRPGVRLLVPGADARMSLPLMIQIEDNGSGVPDHLKPHLFDPFVTTKHNGTGLGLALVAKIVGDHGGIIECESEANRTVFRVLLPMQDRSRKDAPISRRPFLANDRRG
ncbi:ATP-binding protein [Hyphomicrobium sp. LHD-15]|uniref:two-component system sensor histidine kinase NtrB n=1 Tax=Hyphomicrobium sp. LHD-15 TaxID=3072142 RepID=UPI00280EE0D5|nr:ATP-binding protein [Hyphomicrobium sp. LHD-15]MDQ8700407.1 ATP-binding protein [Hyphomicrobium sp. LHD-15]